MVAVVKFAKDIVLVVDVVVVVVEGAKVGSSD